VKMLAEVALKIILFSDGLRIGSGDLARGLASVGRAIFLGMALTLALTAIAARFVVSFPSGESPSNRTSVPRSLDRPLKTTPFAAGSIARLV